MSSSVFKKTRPLKEVIYIKQTKLPKKQEEDPKSCWWCLCKIPIDAPKKTCPSHRREVSQLTVMMFGSCLAQRQVDADELEDFLQDVTFRGQLCRVGDGFRMF